VKPAIEPSPFLRLLAIAAWIGLAYGILEGLESFLLSLLPQGLSWQNGNSVDALLYMPVFYLAGYLLIGFLLALVSLLIRRESWDVVLVFGLAALSGYLAARNQGAVFSMWASALLGLGIGSVVVRGYRNHLDRWRAGVMRSLPLLAVVVMAVIGGTWFGKRLVERHRLAALPAAAGGAPSVLLILLDTQRADHLSAYGYHRPTTPHLDSLAATGLLFEQAYASSSWTLPSHASLFTGRMVHEHDAGAGGKRVLAGDHPTLAERFRDAGYATGGFVANTFWAGRHTGLSRGFLHYEDFYGTPGDALQRMALVRDAQWLQSLLGRLNVPVRKRASQINRDFLGWVDRIDGRPFYAFLNYMDVHAPYQPPTSHEGRFGPIRPELRERSLAAATSPGEGLSPARLAHRTDRYDESLLYLDEQIGRLLGELERRNLREKTIIIVTSDHGEHLGEHGLVEHGKSLYTQETRVPLILWYPEVLPRRITAPVSPINLAATAASLAGLRPAPFPGTSLALMAEGAGAGAVPVVSEMGGTGVRDAPAGKGWLKSLVSGPWHLIVRQHGGVELFDITRDTAETTNLAATPIGAAVAGELQAELGRIVGQPIGAARAGPLPSASPSGSRRIAGRPGPPALLSSGPRPSPPGSRIPSPD
jgi:arylsulfatase A-like enzyme